MVEQARKKPLCPMCGGKEFQHERGKIDSMWGVTAHNVVILICKDCFYVLQFFQGNTIFDMD